ncbi:pilus biosynthesis protein TadE [Algimonas arctica]|uniref:Pilus biosynthesis protein TadE n=1 Tax=Algimonas arctica TaxID=1479486 RepID=A0A8J3CR39_9PROT|nr:TadE/TadG family type IV pilus assembly protein [Algimonas arctica]GHA96818.1 pilus biosynthesis protein TadE [Algimonas arctica]
MNIFHLLKSAQRSLQQSRIARNESGIAAMEFALIAPLIIGLYLGLAEVATVLSVERRVSHSASVAGDLATQVSSVDETDAEDIVSAVLHVANLGANGNFILRLQSFHRVANGDVESEGVIIYTIGTHGGLAEYDKDSLSVDLVPVGEGIVVASVKHAYTPFGFKRIGGDSSGEGFLPDSIDLEEIFLLKPRRSSIVEIGEPGTHTKITCTGTVDSVSCTTA